MKILNQYHYYEKEHYPYALDMFRVIIGTILFVKGVQFVNDGAALAEIIQNSKLAGWAFILEHHVAFTLLAGGLFIAMGLLTRLASLFVFILYVGMAININVNYGLYSVYSEPSFAVAMIVSVAVFLVFGPGYYSLDHYLKYSKSAKMKKGV